MRFQFAPQSRPLPGFVILRGLQRGGFGEVYEGVSTGGKRVALKLLYQGTEVELRGVRQCLNLSHPHLVGLLDIVNDVDGHPWIIMEYMDGIALDDVIASHPKGMPHEEILDWWQGMVAGLEYLHSRGVIHRDLKPSNIYRAQGIVKIGDVGLSKLMDRPDGLHTQTIGTVHYMAPEVSHGRYGPQVDVYSLAIVLYEMLTGRVPFSGETTGEILMRQLTRIPDVSQLPSEFQPILAKALEKDPAVRYSSLESFHRAVFNAFAGQTQPELAVTQRPVDEAKGQRATIPFPAVHETGSKAVMRNTVAQEIPVPLTTFLPEPQKLVQGFYERGLKRSIALKTSVREQLSTDVLASWFQSLGLTFGLSLALAGALAIGLPHFVEKQPWTNFAGLTFLTLQSAIAVCLLHTVFWWARRPSGTRRVRWTTLAACGGMAGFSGSLLSHYLMVEPVLSSTHRAMVMQIGKPLPSYGGSPSLLAWCFFFGLLFAMGNWVTSGSTKRSKHFSISSTLYAAILGWFLGFIIWFPPIWGALFAAWISCVLQLSTPASLSRKS